jgi:hypothetical protein
MVAPNAGTEYETNSEMADALARLPEESTVVLNGVLPTLVIRKPAPPLAILMDEAGNQFNLQFTPWATGGRLEVKHRTAGDFEVASLQVVTPT